ncbi:hypothetical protein FEM48_Zijuj01G0183000 [Ziziphus jujuba var. spinosa]|uniref:Uncharacterized protein n=1 Tax=Ziziphus jujuba var. spinosa TaxID=714518 RepID=A0A978W2U1_ZIZJJ|nr:hypothetical protein FEM48_Zijuj01G0183000 [Ziziphus jujuba var. spinosa]
MLCFRSYPLKFLLLSLFLFFASTFGSSHHSLAIPALDDGLAGLEARENDGVVAWWGTRRFLADEAVQNSSLILAAKRTHRKDPLNNFKYYNGGWNISNNHYWASVAFTAVPFFVVGGIWFVLFGLTLSLICLVYCCCRRERYGYSRIAYALSLIFLVLFTIAAIVGCILLYTSQGKFHGSTTDTLHYIINVADDTVENLRNVSDYLAAAKRIGVNSVSLPADVQKNIDDIQTKINSSATTLSDTVDDNSDDIKNVLDIIRLALIILAAVMLFLTFLGFLFSIFGMQPLVYFLVVLGWVLVTGTFILCGVFLLLHNAVADTCVAMDEWVQHPTAHTALDDLLPCVDNTTAQETLSESKKVTGQLVDVVNMVIKNVTNVNFPPNAQPFYYNQSGPLMPLVCNPFNADLSDRQCIAGELGLDNASQVYKNFVCEVSNNICKTPGRLTPTYYNQMEAAINVSYGLHHYGPFLVDLQDCTFVRKTFTDINGIYCPGLRHDSQLIYIGLLMVSLAVMLSLVFWVIYARERRHRVYTKTIIARNGAHEEAKVQQRS